MNNPCTQSRPIEIIPTNVDFLTKLIRQIIRMQNEASVNECPSCMSGLNNTLNNTKPVSFTLGSGVLLEAITTLPATTTTFFRLEELLDENYVKVRLLTYADGAFTCTTQTSIVKISCICQMQCFDPIFCPLCDSNLN